MKIPFYQVDAFADDVFSGNPAGVCPLDKWPETELMQKIAMENNLSETAFFVKEDEVFHLRWFTPAVEVDLCGHATLATGHVLFNHLNSPNNEIIFESRSGILKVKRKNNLYALDFPTDNINKVDFPEELVNHIGATPDEVWKGREDFLFIYRSQEEVEKLEPDFKALSTATGRGIIASAPGRDVDFVSRFFAPQAGIDEDPVTGSAHTTLTPYWYKRLNKTEMNARQISKRGGNLRCTYLNERIEIAGNAQTFLIGEIILSDN